MSVTKLWNVMPNKFIGKKGIHGKRGGKEGGVTRQIDFMGKLNFTNQKKIMIGKNWMEESDIDIGSTGR